MIPLKDLPNRKQCCLNSCGICTPEMKEISFKNLFKGYPNISVEVPHCRKYGTSLATLEEVAYAELKFCAIFLQDKLSWNFRINQDEANIIRKCLGFTKSELAEFWLDYCDSIEKALLSLVQEQIKLYEA